MEEETLTRPHEVPFHEVSCGNIFADLDLPNAEELLEKAKRQVRLLQLRRQRRMSVRRASAVIGRDWTWLMDINAEDLTIEALDRAIEALTPRRSQIPASRAATAAT